MNAEAQRLLRVVSEGPRKTNVLRGLCASQQSFEQAIGQLFLAGVVAWKGKKSGRQLVPTVHRINRRKT